jgi:hypothetical protein
VGSGGQVALAGVMAETIKAAIAVLGSMASTTSSSSLAWAGSLTPRVPARSDGSCHGALLRHASRLTIEYLAAIGRHVGWVWTSPAAAIHSRFVASEHAELNPIFHRILRVAQKVRSTFSVSARLRSIPTSSPSERRGGHPLHPVDDRTDSVAAGRYSVRVAVKTSSFNDGASEARRSVHTGWTTPPIAAIPS